MAITSEEGHVGISRFEDTGCRVSPSCLNCPLDICVEDRNLGQTANENKRAASLQRIKATSGLTASKAAEQIGITEANVYVLRSKYRKLGLI